MTVPTKAHENDACFDLYADLGPIVEKVEKQNNCDYGPLEDISIFILPGDCKKINTGFSTNIPHGYWAAIFARSGLATKNGLRPAQGVPVIDEPYTGEWIIPIYNQSDKTQYIRHGDRIAQFVLLPYFDTELIEVNELKETDRGEGGFGSSGK
jgi:dUTP pyrophosphatase